MPIYMNVEGMDSDTTGQGHEKWMNIESISWSKNRHIAGEVGALENRESGGPAISDIVVTGEYETAHGSLMDWILGDTQGKTVKIDFCSTDKGTLNIYMHIELSEAMLSTWSMQSNGERPTIMLSFNPTKVKWDYKEQSQEGSKSTTPDIVTYDIALATTV